jgi:hypothetical protein
MLRPVPRGRARIGITVVSTRCLTQLWSSARLSGRARIGTGSATVPSWYHSCCARSTGRARIETSWLTAWPSMRAGLRPAFGMGEDWNEHHQLGDLWRGYCARPTWAGWGLERHVLYRVIHHTVRCARLLCRARIGISRWKSRCGS